MNLEDVPLSEKSYFNLCQIAAGLGISLAQFPWVETGDARERIIAAITEKKAATEAAAREREQAEGERRERLAALRGAILKSTPATYTVPDSDLIEYHGHKYRIEEVAAHREE